MIAAAARRFGFQVHQVQVRLYAGKFAAQSQGVHERRIRDRCAGQVAGGGPIAVFGVEDVVRDVLSVAAQTQYRDNAVLVTMKVLDAAGLLTLDRPLSLRPPRHAE